MKLIPSLLLALLGCCLLLTGCTTAPKISGVTVSIDGFRRSGAAPGQHRAVMILRFTSENTGGIAFSGSSHKVYLNGNLVGKAENENPVGLPPLETLTQEVPIEVVNPAVAKQALAAESEGHPTHYRVESVLRFIEGEDKRELKVNFEGTVSLHGLEAAAG